MHRASLKAHHVITLNSATDHRIDNEGLDVTVKGETQFIPADTIILCAGQEPLQSLYLALKQRGVSAHLTGGTAQAAELVAKQAIDYGTRLAVKIQKVFRLKGGYATLHTLPTALIKRLRHGLKTIRRLRKSIVYLNARIKFEQLRGNFIRKL